MIKISNDCYVIKDQTLFRYVSDFKTGLPSGLKKVSDSEIHVCV